MFLSRMEMPPSTKSIATATTPSGSGPVSPRQLVGNIYLRDYYYYCYCILTCTVSPIQYLSPTHIAGGMNTVYSLHVS